MSELDEILAAIPARDRKHLVGWVVCEGCRDAVLSPLFVAMFGRVCLTCQAGGRQQCTVCGETSRRLCVTCAQHMDCAPNVRPHSG